MLNPLFRYTQALFQKAVDAVDIAFGSLELRYMLIEVAIYPYQQSKSGGRVDTIERLVCFVESVISLVL